MQSILLATDFSERSDRALRRAVLLARGSGSRIHLLHVVDDDRPRRIVDHDTADAKALLDELAQTLENVDGVSCSTGIIQADPFVGITEAVRDIGPDLLILGPHRRQILRDAFVGTTAERSIRAAACPVLMVNGPPTAPYKQTLLTTDLSENARAALLHFERLQTGLVNSDDIAIVHVFDAPALRLTMSDTLSRESQNAYLHDLRIDAQRKLARHTATIGGKRPERIVRHDEASIAHEILTTAKDLKSDLIVMSTQGRNIIERLIMGSVTEQVLQFSPVDVLAIPPRVVTKQAAEAQDTSITDSAMDNSTQGHRQKTP
ncbi:universal stress protein [Granulosicoccus sp. 3-233]|uniref:universal stress protein n=1 Tax=Granulosicoccus sp. 3-233 TaxID=3417969 RepID=UPI003D358068